MRKGDAQLGTPDALYKGTKAAIEALTGVPEGAVAYATDTNQLGSYDGSAWTWGQGTPPPATTAANDFQVGDGSGSWIKKTLAQTITILRTSLDSIYAAVTHSHAWGTLTGTLSDQTDLQTALNAKVPTTRQVNGHALSADVTVTKSDVGLGNVTDNAQIAKDGSIAFTGNQSMGGNLLTNLGTPSSGNDAANKSYVDTAVTGLLDFKGSTDCSGNPNYPSASKGDAYVVSVAGKIGGASGKSVDVGDLYVAIADNAGGTEASVGTSWIVLEHNLQGALLAANNLSDVVSASTARSNLGLVIGTNVQAYDADLDRIAGLAPSNDDLLQLKAGQWTNRSLSQYVTDITELVQDLVAAMFTGGSQSEVTSNYDDPGAIIDLAINQTFLTEQINDILTNGWVQDTATWTRTGNHTFTKSGDHTLTMRKGTKIMYKDGGSVEYGVVASSSYVGGGTNTTTINLFPNTDYTMAAATITNTYYSHAENPEGFPDYFNFAAAPVGFSAAPSSPVYRFKVQGKTYHVDYLEGSNGTSNATTFTASIPVAPAQSYTFPLGTTVDNGAVTTTPGRVVVTSGSTTITFRKDSANAAWTNANGKRAVVSFDVEY